MKSRITVFCLLFLSLSQLSSRAQAFEKSSSLLTVSLGAASMIHIPIGDYRGYYYRSSYTAITGFIRAEFEKGVHKYVGVGGFVDLGGRGGPRNYYYDYYGNYYYSGGYYPSFNISAGAVANFHFYQLIQDKVKKNIHADKLDIYTGVNFGVGIAIHPKVYNNYRDSYTGLSFLVVPGIQTGIRYYFKPNIAVNAEVGWFKTVARAGITFKLGGKKVNR